MRLRRIGRAARGDARTRGRLIWLCRAGKRRGFQAIPGRPLRPDAWGDDSLMFGGLGMFRHAVMFALAVDDVLYLRGEAGTAGPFASDEHPSSSITA